MAGGHRPPLTTDSTPLECTECGAPWPCHAWRHRPHSVSMVLEMVGTPPAYGLFCLNCQKPWPCPDAPEESP